MQNRSQVNLRVILEGLGETNKRNNAGTGRYFHNIERTMLVINSAMSLAEAAGLRENSFELLAIAGAWMDVVQNPAVFSPNKTQSAHLAGNSMLNNGYTGSDIRVVKEMILGSEEFPYNDLFLQRAQGDPHCDSYLARMLADADRCITGAAGDVYIRWTYLRMAEQAGKPVSDLTPSEKLAGWKSEVRNLDGRTFLTEPANRLMGKSLCGNLLVAKNFADGFLPGQ